MIINDRHIEYAFCLGDFIIMSDFVKNPIEVKTHELMHKKQYTQLGFESYLGIIIFPSVITNMIFSFLVRKDIIGFKELYNIYYSMPWEKPLPVKKVHE